MAVPEQVTAALNGLQADADDVAAKSQTKSGTAQALAAAQTADSNAGHDLTASLGKQATDLAAFVALVQEVYGPPSS